MITIKNVLITGANGYIGSNLARQFVQDGVKVHIIIRPVSKLDLLNDISNKLYIHIFSGDIQELSGIIGEAQPDTIFHLAALFIADHRPEQIQSLFESNILYGTQLLEAASATGVRYFINTGTHWQHYNTAEYCPSDLYAATKQAFQDIAHYYTSAFDIRFVTLKLIDVYGAFDPRPKVMSALKSAAKNGKRLGMSGGEQKLGLLYIDDVVKAFLLAAEYAHKMPPHTEKSFIAAPKEIYSLKEIAKIFEHAWGGKLNIDFGKRPYKEREVMRVCCADENILSGIDTMGLYEGLKKVFEAEGEE